MRLVSGLTNILFQSTHSLRSATRRRRRGKRCGFRFNPRTPCGVRLPRLDMGIDISPFQSTHSLRSATWPRRRQKNSRPVSIHALLAECDRFYRTRNRRCSYVSIHALLAECDAGWLLQQKDPLKFQSTHSLRSATRWQGPRTPGSGCFNPRTPCGVRQGQVWLLKRMTGFQSTHSLRSATFLIMATSRMIRVSIHALLAECDSGLHPTGPSWQSFNPRTPCGVRLNILNNVW